MTAEPTPRSHFAGYELYESVSSDAVSTTLRALRRAGAQTEQVALRMVDADLVSHRRAIDGFLRANQRLSAVDHANVLRVVDLGEHAGQPYVATVWREGTVLADMLAEHAPLPIWVALRMAGQLAEALDAVHECGQVHGTVGLRTVWVKRRRRDQTASSAVLTGFGSGYLLASLLQRPRGRQRVDDVLFVAPEQLRGGSAEPATDQYALACLLYMALTGRPPYDGDTAPDVFDGHLHAVVPRAAETHPALAPEWDALFERALAARPDARFDNCRMLVRAASDCAPPPSAERDAPPVAWAPRTVTATPEDPFPHAVVAPPERSEDRVSGRRIVLAVMLAAVVVALVVIAGRGDSAIGSGSPAATSAVVDRSFDHFVRTVDGEIDDA